MATSEILCRHVLVTKEESTQRNWVKLKTRGGENINEWYSASGTEDMYLIKDIISGSMFLEYILVGD